MAPPTRRLPADNEDWSDSDEEALPLAGVETDVLLGVPDGHIDIANDVIDAAVSRIGGLPALLPPVEPPFSSSHCKSCSQPMELLVQMWCPFEDSPMDRALYIWGCARSGCQGKDGSMRAWRGLRYNEKYAAKLEIKLKKKLERERAKAKADEEKKRLAEAHKQQKSSLTPAGGIKPNPFSMSGAGATPATFGGNNPFGMGAHIFGADKPSDVEEVEGINKEVARGKGDEKVDGGGGGDDDDDQDAEGEGSDDGSDSESASDASLLTALASTSITDSAWKDAPSYPPLYLSTVSEYLPPYAKPKVPKGVEVDDGLGDEDKGKKSKDSDVSWVKETYEDSLEVDQVFERFTKRVSVEGQQCIRYELKGTPLPFASDKTFDLLWPLPAQTEALPITKAAFKVVHPQRRSYTPSSIPHCPSCSSQRVFECQLMPNLINVLKPTWEAQNLTTGEKAAPNKKAVSDEERRKEVERALKKGAGDKDEKMGMEWGTCMVFSCAKDCAVEKGKMVKEAWREEVVYIQWESWDV